MDQSKFGSIDKAKITFKILLKFALKWWYKKYKKNKIELNYNQII
jgi:hypothetical protein